MASSVDGLKRQLRTQVRSTMRTARRNVTRELQQAAPKDTGQLERSITTGNEVVNDSRASFDVLAPVPQANFTEFGTRPHVILPRNRRALAFQVGGRRVVVARVNHPGTPRRPWFHPTLRRWPQIVAQAWRQASR